LYVAPGPFYPGNLVPRHEASCLPPPFTFRVVHFSYRFALLSSPPFLRAHLARVVAPFLSRKPRFAGLPRRLFFLFIFSPLPSPVVNRGDTSLLRILETYTPFFLFSYSVITSCLPPRTHSTCMFSPPSGAFVSHSEFAGLASVFRRFQLPFLIPPLRKNWFGGPKMSLFGPRATLRFIFPLVPPQLSGSFLFRYLGCSQTLLGNARTPLELPGWFFDSHSEFSVFPLYGEVRFPSAFFLVVTSYDAFFLKGARFFYYVPAVLCSSSVYC